MLSFDTVNKITVITIIATIISGCTDSTTIVLTYSIYIDIIVFTLPQAIENLTLALCKCQK